MFCCCDCYCRPEFTGAECDVPINKCTNESCVNNGTCSQGVGMITCSCPTGFTGQRCETEIDACDSNQLVSLGLTAQRESITVLMSLVPMVVHATILQGKLLVAVCLGLRDYDVKSISTSVVLVHVAMEVAA